MLRLSPSQLKTSFSAWISGEHEQEDSVMMAAAQCLVPKNVWPQTLNRMSPDSLHTLLWSLSKCSDFWQHENKSKHEGRSDRGSPSACCRRGRSDRGSASACYRHGRSDRGSASACYRHGRSDRGSPSACCRHGWSDRGSPSACCRHGRSNRGSPSACCRHGRSDSLYILKPKHTYYLTTMYKIINKSCDYVVWYCIINVHQNNSK